MTSLKRAEHFLQECARLRNPWLITLREVAHPIWMFPSAESAWLRRCYCGVVVA